MSDIAAIMKDLKKKHGDEVMNQGAKLQNSERIPTGWFDFDLACGGGLPLGRINILYGAESSLKTTLALRVVAAYQRKYPKKKCVFVDIENHYDPIWGKKLGVNNDNLIYVMPDHAEQVVDIVQSLLEASDIGIIVLDSLAALITTNEANSSADKAVVGGAGLVVGKLYRKITLGLSRARKEGRHPMVIAINQIRLKVGVLYGDPECLAYSTRVTFVDGTSMPIGQVVKEKIFKPVWAYNEDTGEFIESNILSHHINGQAKDGDFVVVTAEGVGTGNGKFVATVTYTHNFLTKDGWKRAGELSAADYLVTKYPAVISGTLQHFMLGALCGDATLYRPNNGSTSGIRLQDSVNQEYAKWKGGLLDQFFKVDRVRYIRGEQYIVRPCYELTKFGEQFDGCRSPLPLLKNFTWLGFAIWLMDDGYYGRKRYTINAGRFRNNPAMQNAITHWLNTQGLVHSWNRKNIVFDTATSNRIAINCRKYAPDCMQYKFPFKVQGEGLVLQSEGTKILPTYTKVRSVEPAASRAYRDRTLYDLHIEGHHNYLCGGSQNGVVVHNTMPGGNAFKFASSLTIRLYGKDEVVSKVNATMPSYKLVSGIIKKYKVPITARTFEFRMGALNSAINGIKLAHVEDWKTVYQYLQELGWAVKKGHKVTFLDEVYPTALDLKRKLQGDLPYYEQLKAAIIKAVLEANAIEDASDDEEEDDTDHTEDAEDTDDTEGGEDEEA